MFIPTYNYSQSIYLLYNLSKQLYYSIVSFSDFPTPLLKSTTYILSIKTERLFR